ncbi:MAG: N-methyl-L-tryptophan oxidase [Acetobacteraceae bacterium]|nr:N-methyl-L-tryptophan oxidase [Acetobacteraceae bacterium]
MAPHYDAIVLGVGGMGSAAAWHLARRGRRVLGLERFDIPHRMGSSHGLTRIIRLAYHESPFYVPLLRRAFENWREAERRYGEQLLFVTGSLDIAPPADPMFEGSLASCQEHGLPHEVLTGAEVNARFPGYVLPSGHRALYQPDGGFISSERAIVAHVTLAQGEGADIRARERALGWRATGNGVAVTTERGTYEAATLIVTAGAWVGQFVPALAKRAMPERQVLGWFQPADPALFQPKQFPVFNARFDEGHYYGLPIWGMPGLKLGCYHHLRQATDPDALDRECHAEDEALLRQVVRRYFPNADGPLMGMTACMFTNTPDEHFVIDALPDTPQVIVASPCSGHGFKFASVIGEILADLATTGRPHCDISPFQIGRTAVQ